MTTKELYAEVRRIYPNPNIGIGITVICIDGVTESWSIQVYEKGWNGKVTAMANESSPEKCLKNIKEVK